MPTHRASWAPRRVGTALRARALPPLAAVALLGTLALGTAAGLPGASEGPPSGVPCTALVSNASLNATYSGIYTGLPGLLQNWSSGPNQTRPTNQTGYPNISAGEAELAAAWASICSDPVFASLYAAQGSRNFTSGYELASTGHYVADYGFQWVVSCAGFTTRLGVVCETSTTWTVDLVTGTVAGPDSTEWSAVPTGPPPEPTSSSGGGGGTLLGLPTMEADLVIVGGAVAAGALLLGLGLALRAGRPKG